jgi:DNA polymerase-3 subunit delta
MDLGQLQQKLAKEPPAPLWLVTGEDLWGVEEAIRIIVRAAVPDPSDTMAVTRIDMAEGRKGAKEVVGACRAMGLFTSRLAVVVRAAELLDKKAEERDELARYCAAPIPTTTLILKVAGQDAKSGKPFKLDGRTGLFKALKKNGVILDYNGLKPWEATKWLERRLSELGHRVEPGVANTVVELVGTQLLRLQNVSEQLSLYVGPQARIRQVDVEVALAATRSHSVFELIDSVTDGKDGALMHHLHAMIEHGESPFGILTMVIRHFRQLTLATDIISRGGREREIKEQIGVHPFVAQKLTEQAKRFPLELLRRGFEDFLRADLQVKSSRISPEIVLEQLLLGLADAARGRRRTGPAARRA